MYRSIKLLEDKDLTQIVNAWRCLHCHNAGPMSRAFTGRLAGIPMLCKQCRRDEFEVI